MAKEITFIILCAYIGLSLAAFIRLIILDEPVIGIAGIVALHLSGLAIFGTKENEE